MTEAPKITNLAELMAELNGGVFEQQIERALSDVALGTVSYGDKGKKGKVVVTFDMKRIGESNQVEVCHSITYQQPTARGSKSEKAATHTPLHVNSRGKLSVVPDTQIPMEFDKPNR